MNIDLYNSKYFKYILFNPILFQNVVNEANECFVIV